MFQSSTTSPQVPNINRTANLFIVLSILTGLIGAFINPLMSYFIVEELKSPPMYIGLYTGSVTISGIFISQWLGKLADNGSNVKKLYIVATTGIILALIVFILSNSFYWVLLAGIVFMSFGNASIPQMLTIGRQWAMKTPLDIVKFNARTRAGMSFSWVMGPAAGFFLVSAVGFYASFSVAIACAVLAIIFMWKFIPPKKITKTATPTDTTAKVPASFWFLGLAVMFGMIANISYAAALPLYTVKELHLPSYLPGVLMGLAALLEIPVMLYSSRLTRHWSKNHIMAGAFVFGMTFYLSIFFADQAWQFILLQGINAIFYGLYAGLGISLVQEQIPERIGFTSTFYSNAMKVGMMLGSTSTGFIAQFYSFKAANIGAFIAVLLGALCLVCFEQLKQKEQVDKPEY